MAFYLSDEETIICDAMRIDAAGNVAAPISGGGGRGPSPGVEPAQVLLLSSSGVGPGGGSTGTPMFVLGKAGPAIHQVQVSINGQPTAVASRQGEWFVASWPGGGDSPITVVGFNADGQEITRKSW